MADCAGASPLQTPLTTSVWWKWPTGFFFGYVPRLVEDGLLTEAERQAFEAEWREREQDPGAFLSAPPMVGIIAEKQ